MSYGNLSVPVVKRFSDFLKDQIFYVLVFFIIYEDHGPSM